MRGLGDQLRESVRDAWCAITNKCDWSRIEDNSEIINMLKEQENQSINNVVEIRLRRNFLEQELAHRQDGSQ